VNLTMHIWTLCLRVDSALPGTSQLMERKVLSVQLLFEMSHACRLGLLAVCHSRLAICRGIVSPLMVRVGPQ
jgi:hypothetical protein